MAPFVKLSLCCCPLPFIPSLTMKRLMGRCLLFGILIFASASYRAPVEASTANSATDKLSLSKADPSNDPDKFALELFAEINKPAHGSANDSVWETWALEQRVFGDPNTAPTWPSGPAAPIHTTFTPIRQVEILKEEFLEQNPGVSFEDFVQRNPGLAPQFFPPSPGDEEVRMNKTT